VRRGLLVLIALVAAAYLGAIGYLYAFQRSYVFHPNGVLAAPVELGLADVEIVTLTAQDGTTLTGWHLPAASGQPSILYLHGNAGNLSGRSERFKEVIDSGFGLLAVSYRGYAGSGGSPSEATLFADALLGFDWLADRADGVVVHGESLGTGIATYVAAERPARALVLEAPYTSALDMAGEAYPWVPVSLLMRDPFLTREHIKRVEEPILIVHGTEDRVIPVEHGRRLFELAPEPKQLAIVDGAGHDNLWDAGLWPTVLEFLRANGVSAQAPAAVRVAPSLAGR